MVKTNTKTFIFLLVVSLVVFQALFSALGVRADSHTLTVASAVSISSNGRASVKHVVTLQGADKSPLPAEVTIPAFGTDLKGLSATGEDNQKLTTSFDPDGRQIRVKIPSGRQKNPKAWSFALSFSSQGLGGFGAVKALQIPGFDTNLSVTRQTLSVSADLDLGFVSVRGPQPASSRIGVGQQILGFASKKGALADSVLLTFGDQTESTIDFEATLKNDSWWWRDVEFTLPPDSNQQRVVINSIEPKPTRITLDRDGNIVAVYRIGPLGSRLVKVSASALVSGMAYELENAGSLAETDPLMIERYTRLTDAWQPAGVDVTTSPQDNAGAAVKKVFQAIVNKAREDQEPKDTTLSVKERNSALGYSDWLVGELRSRQIPARLVLGVLQSDGDRLSEPRQHAWVEANVAGVGWITLDPWLGVFTGEFGAADPLRVALAVWGIEDDRPPVDLSVAKVIYKDKLSDKSVFNASSGSLKLTKQVILPFVSVLSIRAERETGGIVDGVTLRNGQTEVPLGSLAPFQSVTLRSLRLGGAAFSGESGSLGALAGGDFQVWASDVPAQVSYMPLVIETVLALSIVTWVVIRKKRGGAKPYKPSKEALTLHDEALGGSVEAENLILPQSTPVQPPAVIEPDDPPPPQPPRLIQ